MNETRFAPEAFSQPPQVSSGFLLVPLAPVGGGPAAALQQLYQQIYQQAIQANQPRLPDLFANMN
jgi:hypothetical protein